MLLLSIYNFYILLIIVEFFSYFLALNPFITNKNSSLFFLFKNLIFSFNSLLLFYSLLNVTFSNNSIKNLKV